MYILPVKHTRLKLVKSMETSQLRADKFEVKICYDLLCNRVFEKDESDVIQYYSPGKHLLQAIESLSFYTMHYKRRGMPNIVKEDTQDFLPSGSD